MSTTRPRKVPKPKMERIPLAGSREERELRLNWLGLLLQVSSDIRGWAGEFEDILAQPPPPHGANTKPRRDVAPS
jgi:hypothetical protein